MDLVAYRFGGAALARRVWRRHVQLVAVVCAILVGFGLCLAPGSASAQSVDIPLNLTLMGTNDAAPVLTINIGINGQPVRPYLFDTGSEIFVAQYDPTYFGSVPLSMSGQRQNLNIRYGDGSFGYTYNITGTPSLTFYPSYTSMSGGITLNAVSPSGAASQFLMGAVTNEINFPFPDGPQPGGYTGGYGIFGAGNFLSGGPGSVLGQAVVPGTTAGYVVAANGQPLSAMNAGSKPQSSTNGPQVGQNVTSCSPCVMLGLTPALIAQFKPANTVATQRAPADGFFANSGAPATIQYPYFWNISVGGHSVSSRTLLDTGTFFYGISNQISTSAYANGGTLTISGPGSGATQSTVTLYNNSSADTCCNPYYGLSNGNVQSVIGLGFYLNNSVLYNLAGEAVGYTPNFVTDVNIATAPTSPLVIDQNSVALGLAGVISGSGALQLVNGGSATLSGTNTYTGATVVNNSFLALVGPGSISQSSGVSVSNFGVFDISGVGSGAPTGAYITSLSSTDNAGLVLLGANQLVLTNANSTFAGTIADGGSYGGSGGSLAIIGGNETLSGQSTYTGPTVVDAGVLTVTGSIVSPVFVNAGGVLAGSGTVGSTTINAGGLLAPANPGGALTVQGNLVFATAGAYLVEINNNLADRVNVTGSAALAGNVYAALVGSTVSKQYDILTATGGLSGGFASASVVGLPALSPSLSYGPNDVLLNLSLNYAALGNLNANQQRVGNAISNFFNSTGSIPVNFATLAQSGLSQVAGESATGSQQTTFQAMNQFVTTLLDPFIGGRESAPTTSPATGYAAEANGAGNKALSPNERDAYAAVSTKAPPREAYDPHWSAWASAFGGSQSTDGNASVGSNSATSSIFGMAAGADYLVSPHTIAGFALAGGGTSFNVLNAGSGQSDLFQAGGFVRHNVGPAYLAAALAYGWQDVTTDRLVLGSKLHAEFDANALSGRVEGGTRFATRWFGITPYAAGQSTSFFLPNYAETTVSGSNAFALAYGAQTVTDTRSELGFRTDRAFALTTGLLTLRSRFAWAHDYNPDRAIAATFQALPGASFVVNGAAQASESALTTLSAELAWRNGWSASATFEGEFSKVTTSYAGKGVVRYAW